MFSSETSLLKSLPKYLCMYRFGRLSVLEGGDIRRLAMASSGACFAAPHQGLHARCSHIFRPE